MSYDNLSSVSQNVLKFYQLLTGEERWVPFIFGHGKLRDFGNIGYRTQNKEKQKLVLL
jgi:hypothetical protein